MKKLKIFFLSLGLIGMSLNSVEALDNKEFEEPKQTYSAPVRQKMGVDILPKHEEGQTSQDKKPVLFVMGVDGIYGPLFEKMIEEGWLPNFRKVKDMGAWTFEANTSYRSHTMPQWVVFMYGRVSTWLQKIQDTACWKDINSKEVGTRNYGKTNICKVLGGKDLTFFITNWSDLTVIIPDNETTKASIPSLDGSNDKPDSEISGPLQEAINSRKYNFIFAHFDKSDDVAQNSEWDKNGRNPDYEQSLIDADNELGKILSNPNLDFKNKDYLSITSDHGRNGCFSLNGCFFFKYSLFGGCIPGQKHDCLSYPTVRHIPLFVAGPGIPHHEIMESVSIADMAPSLAALMGKDKGDMEGEVYDFIKQEKIKKSFFSKFLKSLSCQ